MFPLSLCLALACSSLVNVATAATTAAATTKSCPSSDYSACGGNLPGNFCCPSDSTCVVTYGSSSIANTTAICCPLGSDCTYIAPITCNAQLLNATAHPSSYAHTTELYTHLATCGGGSSSRCCPPGFSCRDDVCVQTARHVATVIAGNLFASSSSGAAAAKTVSAAAAASLSSVSSSSLSVSWTTSFSPSSSTASSSSTSSTPPTAPSTSSAVAAAAPAATSPTATTTATATPAPTTYTPTKTVVVGSVIAGVVGIALLAMLAWRYRRRLQSGWHSMSCFGNSFSSSSSSDSSSFKRQLPWMDPPSAKRQLPWMDTPAQSPRPSSLHRATTTTPPWSVAHPVAHFNHSDPEMGVVLLPPPPPPAAARNIRRKTLPPLPQDDDHSPYTSIPREVSVSPLSREPTLPILSPPTAPQTPQTLRTAQPTLPQLSPPQPSPRPSLWPSPLRPARHVSDTGRFSGPQAFVHSRSVSDSLTQPRTRLSQLPPLQRPPLPEALQSLPSQTASSQPASANPASSIPAPIKPASAIPPRVRDRIRKSSQATPPIELPATPVTARMLVTHNPPPPRLEAHMMPVNVLGIAGLDSSRDNDNGTARQQPLREYPRHTSNMPRGADATFPGYGEELQPRCPYPQTGLAEMPTTPTPPTPPTMPTMPPIPARHTARDSLLSQASRNPPRLHPLVVTDGPPVLPPISRLSSVQPWPRSNTPLPLSAESQNQQQQQQRLTQWPTMPATAEATVSPSPQSPTTPLLEEAHMQRLPPMAQARMTQQRQRPDMAYKQSTEGETAPGVPQDRLPSGTPVGPAFI